ncbi:replication-relaxation family protein [Halapricum hydrolyticum]|uniref:Winged helix-turn-helix domain-containing protein n=1 Tax=Halapricum hydrolyticum TaxID=2979991 RepID=A0AAE3IAI7_9EURY|nr:replication-relaxation family protein [Halapricum hydrolyticum]MCU4716882.1 winged helix-turn-helix domain-containing protein [Halapricum hydrolyticum]MCU4725513.1 winged helix-turn-helix domain-containing protein [Halapricum hydrolyticum]
MDRQSAHWMKREDERILEFLEEEGLSTASLISREVFESVSMGHVRERLHMLAGAELVGSLTTDRTHWELTQAGQRYLDGDLDAENQPRPRLGRVLRND